ncbi:Alpha/beta hydrolase fold-1 [Camillea tinctor]|nr:Alpha/beta hydrolase fold-1 [Camillea tinctor]
MASKQPVVVLVPGAWTESIAYRKLVDTLEAKAFVVHVPSQPTNDGHHPPDSSFDADVQAVREVVDPLVRDGKEVIMLMHSYGGVVGTNAVKGLARKYRQAKNLQGGIIHLIYAASFMLSQNQTIRTVVQQVGLEGRSSLVKFIDDGTWFPEDPLWLLYHDLKPEDQKAQVKLLKNGNTAILTGEATYEAWKDIPTDYVRTSLDRWLPPEYQDFCLKNAHDAGVSINVSVLDSGHSPYVKFPEKLAELAAQVPRST